jgi:hypothetical protein
MMCFYRTERLASKWHSLIKRCTMKDGFTIDAPVPHQIVFFTLHTTDYFGGCGCSTHQKRGRVLDFMYSISKKVDGDILDTQDHCSTDFYGQSNLEILKAKLRR